MNEDNLLPELGVLGQESQVSGEAKPVEQMETSSLLRVTPTELTSPYAGEAERINYRKAVEEYNQGIESAPDILDVDGTIRSVKESKATDLLTPYLKTRDATSEGDIEPMDVVEITGGSLAEEEAAYYAAKNAPAIAREKRVMENYVAYQAGQMTYEDFLIKTYGNDVLKAQGYHTDSIVWWKSQFREGNYQHPLDNEYLRAGVVQQAESLFALESFYNKMLGPSKNLENLVGKTLEGEDYKRVFGESWDKAVEALGSYERAVTYFKGGYLGDMLNQLVYEQYDNAGNPVGDPKYYMAADGKLYELVDRNTTDKIDKSRQMFLYKNADGSVDRVSTAKGWLGELTGSFVNGMAGAFLGIVDLVSMIGIEWGTAFKEDNGWDAAAKLFLPLVNKLWNKDDKAFTDAYAKYNATTNQWKTPTLKVQGFDNDKWDSDNITRAVGSALGFITETTLEIAIGVATAGAGSAAIAGGKAAKKAGTSTIKGVLSGIKTQLTSNLSRLATKKTLGEGVEVLIEVGAKEATEEAIEKGVSEVTQKLANELGEAGLRELLEASGGKALDLTKKEVVEENGKLLLSSMVRESMESLSKGTNKVVNIGAKEVQEGIIEAIGKKATEVKVINGGLKSVGRFIKEGSKWTINKGVRLSNTLRMLNSGSTPLGTKMWTKMLGGGKFAKKWATSFSRGTLGAVITIGETAANQRVLQQVRPELEDETIIKNSLIAGFITLGSTLLLSSSTDDKDNIERLSKNLSEERSYLLAQKNLLGDNYSKEAVEKLTQEFAKEKTELAKKVLAEFDKFDIGKYLKKESAKRIAGGFSELLDNVLTSSVRSAANMGVESIWGTVFSTEGILNPEVLVPAMLSTGVSVVGRKGLFGKGENEGSFTKGAAASKATVQKMFTDTMTILDILARNAEVGSAEAEQIIMLKTQLQQDYATAWKNNNANTALAAIDVLENLSKGLGSDPANPLSSIDNLIKNLSTTDAFQTALKNKEFAVIEGMTNKKGDKLNTKFSFSKYIGDWYDKDNLKNVYAYERAVITEYEVRRAMKQEALGLAGKDSTKKITTHLKNIAKNFLHPLQKALTITESVDNKNRYTPDMARLFTEIAGEYGERALSLDSATVANSTEAKLVLNALSEAMGNIISDNELKLVDNHTYSRYETIYANRVKSSSIDDLLISQKQFVLDLTDKLIAKGYAKDIFEANKLILSKMKGNQVELNDLTPREIEIHKFLDKEIATQNEINKQYAIDYGMTQEELNKVLVNAGDKEIAKKHIENGMVMTFATRKDIDLAKAAELGSEEREYAEAVIRGVRLLNKFNELDGEGAALDFVILNDGSTDGAVKVFIASPNPIDNIISIIKGPERLKKVILLGGLISNKNVSAENLREYTEALYSIIKPTDKVFTDVNSIIEHGLIKNDPNDYRTFLNVLAAEDLIDKEALVKVLLNMGTSTDKFHIDTLKAMKDAGVKGGVTGEIVQVIESVTTIRKILNNISSEEELPRNTATQLAKAAKTISEIAYKKGNEYLLNALDMNDRNEFQYSEIIKDLAKAGDKNFQLTQSLLETSAKAFSVQSTIYSNELENKKQAVIKKLRTIKELGLDKQFDESLKEMSKRFEDDAARIGAIDKILSDPVELEKIIRSKEAAAEFNKVIAKYFAQSYVNLELSEGKTILDIPFLKEKKLVELAQKEIDKLTELSKTQALTAEESKLLEDYTKVAEYAIEDKGLLSINELLSTFPGIEKLLTSEEATKYLRRKIINKKLDEAQKDFNKFVKYYVQEMMGEYYDSIMADEDVKTLIKQIKSMKGEDGKEASLDIKLGALKGVLVESFNNAVIYSNAEEAIYKAIQAKNDLYKADGVIAFPSNVKKITVNVGEVVTKAYSALEKELYMRGINNDNQYSLDDVIAMARGNPDIVKSIQVLTSLYHKFGNSPVLQFDLELETDKTAFYKLLTSLGYDMQDFNEASEGKVLKIPGMYFNNDNAAIDASKGKYKTLSELIKREMNALTLSTIQSTQSQSLVDLVLIRSMFPEGIIGLNENSLIRTGENKVAFNMNADDNFELLLGYHKRSHGAESKSGKLANLGNAFYTEQIATIFAGKSPVEFENYMLLRSMISELVEPKVKDMGNVSAKLFKLPDDITDEHRKTLMSFGWTISNEDSKYINGFDFEKNAEFFKTNNGEVNLFEVLPIKQVGDNDFVRHNDKEGGGTAQTFESMFFNQLNKLFGGDGNEAIASNGKLKILPNVTEGALEIPSNIKTFGEAIEYFSQKEFENNLTAISFVFALKASIKASEAFDDYLTKRFSPEKVARLKIIGVMVDHPEVLKELAGNNGLSDEEILDNVKKRIRAIRQKGKNKKDSLAPDYKESTTIEAKTGNIYIGESFTQDISQRLPNPNLIELEDIALLRKYATQAFLDESDTLLAKAPMDYKNRFLSLLAENEDGTIGLPVANISRITLEDLEQEIEHNKRKLKLGSYIKETFGEEFYNNLYQGIELYNKTFLIKRSNKLKTSSFTVPRDTPTSSGLKETYYHGSLDKERALMIGKNAYENKDELARRRIADEEIVNASVLTSKDKTELEPLVDFAIKNIDSETINPFQTTATTRVANLNNRIVASNQLDNIVSIKDMLIQNKLSIGDTELPINFSEEKAEELATQIVTLSNTSLNKAKTSFIVLEVDEVGEPKTTLVLSDDDDPYTRLLNTLVKKGTEDNGSKYYLLQVETGFALKSTDNGTAAFKMVDITGFNKATDIDSAPIGRKLFLNMLVESVFKDKSLKDDMSIDEFNKQVSMLLKNYHIDQETEFLKQMISDRYEDKLDVIQPMLSLFKNKISEINAASSRKGYKEQTFFNTLGTNNSILKQRETNATLLRRQGVIFDNLDRENKDVLLASVINKAANNVQEELILKPKAYRDKVNSIVEDLLEGRTPKIKLSNSAEDRDALVDVLRLFATKTDNTAFQKYVLQNINSNGEVSLATLKKERSDSELGKKQIQSMANNGQGFELRDVADPTTSKFSFDSEWIFSNKKDGNSKRFIWQLGYTFVDEFGETVKQPIYVKVPEEILKEIIKAKANPSIPSEYSDFVKFLEKDKNYDNFINAQKKALTPEEAMSQMKEDILSALSNENVGQLVFMSHNGKGKNSDIETMRETFGEHFVKIDKLMNGEVPQEFDLGKTILGHVDLFNDVLNKTFLDTSDVVTSDDTKRNLQSLGRKYISKDYVEKHLAHDDAADLLEIFDAVYETGNVKGIASTKVLDYIDEIYSLLSGNGKEIPVDLYNKIQKSLNFAAELDEDEMNHLTKWRENTKLVTEDMQKLVFDSLDHIQKRIEKVNARIELEEAIRRQVPFDYETLKAFFEEIPSNAGLKVKNAFEKIYTIIDKLGIYGDDIDDRITSSVINALKKLHVSHMEMENSTNKMHKLFYSDDTFISFTKSVIEEGDAYIDRVVNEIIKSSGKKIDSADIIKSADVTELQTGLKNVIDTGVMEDIIPNSIASKAQKKITKLVNNLLFDMLSDTTGGDHELITSLGDQLFTIMGSEIIDGTDVERIYKDAANTIYLNDNSLVSQLRELQTNGFADVLSIEGLYRVATAISPGMKKRLGLETTTGKIITNDAGVEKLLGMSLDEYKKVNGLEGEKVFVSIFRQPGDRMNPIHAYELLVDNSPENGKNDFFAISAHEIVSKHGGDFDGDKINIVVPDVPSQKAFNQSGYLEYINKPYIAMEKFINKLYEEVGIDYIRKDTMRFLKMQKAVADVLKSNDEYYAKPIFEGIMRSNLDQELTIKGLLNNEATYDNFIKSVKARAEELDIDLKDIDIDALDKEIFESIVVKESRGYLLHNRNIVDGKGKVYEKFLRILNKNARKEAYSKILFGSELTYRDSVTGEAQKILQKYNNVLKGDAYITLKFDGDIYKMIAEANKTEEGRVKILKALKESGIDNSIVNEFIGAAIKTNEASLPLEELSGQQIYNIFALNEELNYKNDDYKVKRKAFGQELYLQNKNRNIELEGKDPVEAQINRIIKGVDLYNSLMPTDFYPTSVSSGKRLSNKEALILLDMARNSERYNRARDTKSVLTYKEAVDLGFTKEVSVLVDLDEKGPIQDATAKVTTKKNYIYVSEGRSIYDSDFKSKYEGKYEKVTKKPQIIGMYAVDVYRLPFDNNLKLASLNAGRFGKVELTGGVETDPQFKDYDYIIGLSTFKKANESFNPDTVDIDMKDSVVEINGKKYIKIKMQVGVNENVAGWPQDRKDISVDPISMVHSFGTVESLPVFGGAFAKINEKGEIEWDANSIAQVAFAKEKARKSTLRPNNFLSTYNQLRAIKVLQFGLENIKATPENEAFITMLKEDLVTYKQPNKNFGSEEHFAYVTDLIKSINDKTNNGFLKYLDTKANEVNKRLFSKTLWDMAFFNSSTMFNFDSVKEKYRETFKKYDANIFYSKGGAKGIALDAFNSAEVPTHIAGETVDIFSGDTSYSKLYMNQLDALNYLISDAKPGERSSEYLSINDVLSFIKAGYSNIALFDESSMAEGYLPKVKTEGLKTKSSIEAIKAMDRDNKSGISGKAGEKQNALTTTWGIRPSASQNYRYYPDMQEVDTKSNPIYKFRKLLSKFIIENGKILEDDNRSSVRTNVTVPRFLKQITTLLNDELSTNDKILRFKSMEPDSVVAHINPSFLDLEDGVVTSKYFTDPAVKKNTFAEIEEILNDKFKTTIGGQIYSEKEKLASQENILGKEEIEGLKALSDSKKTVISQNELLELKANLTKNSIEEDTASDFLAASKANEKKLLSKARERMAYFKNVHGGNIEEINFKKDLLDTEGMAVNDVNDIYMKQGIQNFYINSKRYQMELTDGLEMIKRSIGNDTYKLDEFNKFTQARLIQLAYQEAKLKSNDYSINKAKEKIREMGFTNIDDVENFLSSYNRANKGLVNIYFKTIDSLKTAAMEAATITGAKDTPDELFLLSPLKKKVDSKNTNKLKYYSVLDTIFLDKRSSLDSIIEQATDLNFGLSVWYLAGNLGKIKAINDAQKMFVKAGAIENKSIYEIANRDFGERLRATGESENKMSKFEKEELISVLKSKHPNLNLSNELVNSPNYLAEIYDEIERYILDHNGPSELKRMTLYELDEKLKTSKDEVEKSHINALIEAKKTQRDFMSDVITQVPSMAKAMVEEIKSIARSKGAVLTNEFMQMLPEDGRSNFSFLAGYDLKTIKRNVEYHFSGDTPEQRIAYMALTGNLFLSDTKLANHLDKYYFTEKLPSNVEKILNQAKNTFTNFVMSMPHKLINRMTQYSIGDLSLITVVDPTVITKVPEAMSELGSFYNSKGASLERSPKLKLFLETIGFDPTSYRHGSLNFETMDYDSKAKVGQAYFDAVEKVFTAQTLTFRYALWSSLYDRFEAYEANPSKDKRLYGSLDYMRNEIDAMENSAVKAREIMNAAIGGPNGFALIARKELKNWGMFMTYPLALMRAGVGHLKSMAGAFDEFMAGTANNATRRYVVNTGLGIVATQVAINAIAALIASIYGVDKETEEEWKKKGTYIDPFLTLINDRPIPLSGGTTGLTKQLREMFYEPLEEADGNIVEGAWNWLTANVISKLNPLVKVPLELFTGKEFYGNAGPQDTTSRNFQENFAHKVLSMFIGQSGAVAMTDQWYYSRVGQDDRHFVSKLAESFKQAIKGEMGNYRGYKQESKNYFKALNMLRGFKAMENEGNNTVFSGDNGFNLEDMSALSKEIKTAMDKEQPPSVIYGIIDEYIKEGASSSTIKAAIFNNSISGKISQIKNFDQYYKALSSKERTILDDAIKYEETNYSILKSMVADYIDSSKNNYKKNLYIPRNYYTYPSYNKYNNYKQYQRDWFKDERWKQYAKDYMKYRAKENFVPSLTPYTGKYAKDFYDYGIPKIKRVSGKIETARYEEDGYDRNNHRVNKKGR